MKILSATAIFYLTLTFNLSSAYALDSISSLAVPEEQSHGFHLSTDFALGGIGFKEFQDESQLVQFSVRPNGAYSLTETFEVRGDIQLNVLTGRSQSRFQNPNFNLINILELAVFYEPIPSLQISAGVINQDHFNNRMLVADLGFPGVMLNSHFSISTFKITPKVQYAIPTSTSFESDRNEAEALPNLTSLGIEAEWLPTEWLRLDANVNQFEYSNLPSVVAFNSSRLGNSVIGTAPSETQFRYNFAGISQAYGIQMDYSKILYQSIDLRIVDNQIAPRDRQRSQWVGTSFSFDFGDFSLAPEYAQFFAESDSVPAFYSAFELGRSNRRGQSYGFEINLKKLGVSVDSQFVDARLIEARPSQADMQIFMIALEFNNVTF